MPSGWWQGLMSGVLATLIGFGLTMIWDLWKTRRDEEHKDRAMLRALKAQVDLNADILIGQGNVIRKELEVMQTGRHLLEPLVQLHSDLWDLAKNNLPKQLTNEDTVTALFRTSLASQQVNEWIRSREEHRLHNRAMSDFTETYQKIDHAILRALESAQKELALLRPFLVDKPNKLEALKARFRRSRLQAGVDS